MEGIRHYRRVAQIESLVASRGKNNCHFGCGIETLVSVALNYVLAHPNVACVIPGFRNERQAKCNLTATQHSLSEDDLRFIREALA